MNRHNKNRIHYQNQKGANGRNSWRETNEAFVNPYNFVSLGEKCQRFNFEELMMRKDLLTGVIDCTLETKTPIFIPNTTSLLEEARVLDFYSYRVCSGNVSEAPAEPVIPASEIRGVIRSAFEALTDSCLSTTEINRDLNKRTTKPGKPGILRKENNQWYLYPARRIKFEHDENNPSQNINNYKEGEKVYVLKKFNSRNKPKIKKEHEYDPQNDERDYVPGYIHKGEPFPRKRYESIFRYDEGKEPVPVCENDVERLKKVVRLYQETKKNNDDSNVDNDKKEKDNNSGNKPYQEYQINEKGTLVYYNNYNGIYYFSPSCISNEVFSNTLEKILKLQGEHQSCNSRAAVCPACALFGMASDKGSLASRVRITDARVSETKQNPEDYYEDWKVLDELSSPKIQATEFYLERPGNVDLWNYDYAGNWRKSEIETLTDYQPKIRGRKFYWHSKLKPNWHDYREKAEEDNNLSSLNCIIRPLKGGVYFRFRIYFERLTEKELKQLIWTLNIGDNNNSHCHKIGMGKPLGLGSIKIKVDEITLRKIRVDHDIIRYEEVQQHFSPEEIEKEINIQAKHVQEFLKITDFEHGDMNISYPIAADFTQDSTQNQIGGHQWFIGNRQIHAKNDTRPKVHRVLPYILDTILYLKGLEKRKV